MASAERGLMEDLPGDLARIADIAGLEVALKIGQAFRGTYLYITGVDAIKRKLRDEVIRRDYDKGERVKALCMRHELTERQVRRILAEAPIAVQDHIFELLKMQ